MKRGRVAAKTLYIKLLVSCFVLVQGNAERLLSTASKARPSCLPARLPGAWVPSTLLDEYSTPSTRYAFLFPGFLGGRFRRGSGVVHPWVHPFASFFVSTCTQLPMTCTLIGREIDPQYGESARWTGH